MVRQALMGLWVTCVFSALHPSAAIAAAPDIVLYASDAANLHGNWTRMSDATAAGGQLLSSADTGWATTSNPLAAPADYFEFSFNALANTPYHVWTRTRAAGNSKYNDSLFAQFSDAVDVAGAPVFGVGTTSGVSINLATDAAALGLSGWGWQDGAYWLTQPKTVTFAATGSHTLRIQTREDGVQLDQVVLSPALYLTSAPGTSSNDTHIIAKPIISSTPWTGTALSVPGSIEAEAFDNGGEGLAYHDATVVNSGGAYRQTGVDLQAATENGYNVGWIAAGEWLNYTVNVASTGSYLLEARVASFGPGGTFHVELGGSNVTGTLTIPNTGGWQNWTTVSTRVALTAGPQVMRVVFDTATASAGDVGNLNWIRMSTLASTPFNGVAIALPGTLHAENFDNGGEGLGYHDTTTGNTGGQYRNTDVDIEPSSLGGFNVGWLDTNEWLAYSVNVATTGAYTLQFQVASATGGGQLHASFRSINTTTASVPSTGGWQTWSTVTTTANLVAGQQVMKVSFDTGWFNIAGITVVLIPAPPPPPPPPSTGVPLAYNAITDRNTRVKPALPQLGSAGSAFTDPTFGSRMVRVTDANTRPAAWAHSYSTPSASHQNAWNTNSTFFYLRSTDGAYIPYSFEALTMSISRIGASSTGDGGLTIYSNTEPQFSFVSPNIIYGAIQDSTSDWPILRQYDFSTGSFTDLLNLGSVAPLAQHTYAGGLASSAGAPEKLLVFFGGYQQDAHYLATVLTLGGGSITTVDTLASTVTSNGTTVATDILLKFHLHHALIDKSGRYVILETTSADRAAPRHAAPKYVWDTTTHIFTALNDDALSGGHYSAGFGMMINHDCCTTTAWDAGQWQLRSLATPTVTQDLITTLLTPKEVYLDDHNSWNNARSDALAPVISATYRLGINPAPWRAWDEELIAVQSGAGASGAAVWRFAHHRSDARDDLDPSALGFWYEPRPNVSQDGRWAIFTSNWEKTLGVDVLGQPGSIFREDVFLVELVPKP